jgi:hypothetical protein
MNLRQRTLTIVMLAGACLPVLGRTQEAARQRFKHICPPCSPVSVAQAGLEKINPGALDNPGWALGEHGVNSEKWQAEQGSRLIGTGATILQIDTGVTEHPLLRIAVEKDDRGVDVESGRDLYGPGHTNNDPLLAGFLRFPGHGTKTASVIIAQQERAGSANASDGFTMVKGVAPGARIVAVRATQGVVLFPQQQIGELEADQRKVAHALEEAAKGEKGHFRRRIDVVSMSLGGWPSTPALCESVAKAVAAKVIVLAAAGNVVSRTKYPARCPDAIAIAGSTFIEAPWDGSAGSEDVAVAAPAEGVWTASVTGGQFCMEASSGTSFSVALVAGMAAEWVAVNRAKKTLPENPAAAFRAALAKSARPWAGADANRWRRKFGAGIADLTRLM